MKHKRRNKPKQILSLMLALLMVLFCFPVTALGTDELEEPISETLEAPADAELTAFERGVGELGTAELESMTLNVADVPELVSAQAIAEKDHVLRLREQEEDLNTVIFQNRDGGKTVYLYANPVKYVDDDGNVKDRSTALTAGNVIMGAKVYAYSATDNAFGQYYPTQPQNGVLLAFGEYFVEMTPVITGILTLRDTTTADNKVTYNKVFGNGTSLVYTPTLSGVKEDIILQAYTGKSSFSFTVKTNGLAIIQQNGDTFLADFEGNKVASLGKVVITDKVGKTIYGSMTVVTKTEREEYTVTVNAPTAFLTSAETVYPVTVDPTLTINEEFALDPEYYEAAIEDLCVYDGTEDPIYDHIASIGAYQTGYKSAMLYRITPSAWDLLGVNYYLDSGRFDSATLHVPVLSVTTGIEVATTPSLGSWTNGTSQNVESMYFEDYYPDSSSDTTQLSSSANSAGAEIDVTKVFEYFGEHPAYVSRGFMMYVYTGTALSNPQNYFSVYQVEESSENVYFEIDYDIFDGAYYINNKESGKFMNLTGTAAVGLYTATSGIYTGNPNQSWSLELVSNDQYYIKAYSGNLALCDLGTSASPSLEVKTHSANNKYKWEISFYGSGGRFTIRNVATGNYLKVTNGIVGLSNAVNTECVWRLCEVDEYIPLTSFSVADIVMAVGETVTPTIVSKAPANATWANFSDFSWSSGNNSITTVSSSGVITPAGTGGTTITVAYKLTGQVRSFVLKVFPILIYQTEATYRNDANGDESEDLDYNDLIFEQLKGLWSITENDLNKSSATLRNSWETRCLNSYANGTMDSVVSDMIEHFMEGSGQPYSNETLTEEVKKHSKTKAYIKNVTETFKDVIQTYEGDVNSLIYDSNNRKNSVIVEAMLDSKNNPKYFTPVYDGNADIAGGLTICIHDWHGVKIEITEYSVTDNNYTCTLKYTFYDHFGLDQLDVSGIYGFDSCFQYWYILQHYNKFNGEYKPFVTLVEFEDSFSGTLS